MKCGWALLVFAMPSIAAPPTKPVVLDAFDSSTPWSAVPASGVTMKLTAEPGPHGNALRVDFDFHGGGGYAVLHRKLDLDLPENYRFEFQLRGGTEPQNLELKLIDDSGENVWWCNQVNFEYPREWTLERVRKRQISFAWGPRGGGALHHVAAIEFAITAGSGGKGTVWFDDLTLVPTPVAGVPPPIVAAASSFARGHEAANAADTLADTWWESLSGDRGPTLTLDLGTSREFGGIIVDWRPGKHASGYDVEFDDGDGKWRVVREVRNSDGGRDWLDLPESETRRMRLHMRAKPAGTVAVVGVRVMPLEWAATPESFLMAVAQDSPRGHYPRAYLDEQVYWTVVGADGDRDEGLLDEDGRLETGKSQFSIEPFLITESGVRTWADGTSEQRQEVFPTPQVVRRVDSLSLSVTVFALPRGKSTDLVAEYDLVNHAEGPRRITLCLALRPLPVNPPSQFLNTQPGAGRIDSIRWTGDRVIVNRDRAVGVWAADSARFRCTAFDEGDLVAMFSRRDRPTRRGLSDPTGRASGVIEWTFDLGGHSQGNSSRLVMLDIPFHGTEVGQAPAFGSDEGGLALDPTKEAIQGAIAAWDGRLGSMTLGGNREANEVYATLHDQLGYVLVNRDSAGIQPGSRSYERSWIRDGSLTSSALLHAGMAQPVKEFLLWYADHQYPDGKVPCCVDQRGSDPVPENDSHGEFVYLTAEYLRLTGDWATAERVYPHVRAAVAYMDTLRAQRRTPEWRSRANAPYYGLLPPSISHEGYSAKPMHSYWDDLFALRGYKDGVWLATQLGRTDDARWMSRSRDEFAHDFAAAVVAAMKAHHIDYIPGCSDLGDFDATSTTIALNPVQAGTVLPESALVRTFERYWEFFVRRRDGIEKWDAFTPYEMRNIGTFVRLGWRERADELLDWFMQFRRPAGWRQWAEVVDQDPRHARFIGDMPHTWVGTDFVRSVMDMLAYERESDSALVLCAGIPSKWLEQGEVKVRDLRTRWGAVSYVLHQDGAHMRLALDSSGLRTPPGGIVFAPPVEEAAHVAGQHQRAPRIELEGVEVRAHSPDGRYVWKPTKRSPRPPRSIKWDSGEPATGRGAKR